ncbi:hypothetical protein RHSP_32027 [Rhizobium freirei PRF 81]|uniref:Uncharacterized protein n=1 Tax=Rhizobium freirei PRF 81 TaxID=363754 RepID=N6UWP8_9HYPH|nr:hypothetical protein [Rhizobium freirei]ENN86070.1 hypothetical protein RHSP_32027 [Rhizobium freirei PRF 81]
MNLHGLVSGAIGTVNPFVDASMQNNTGYTTNDDGVQIPTYVTATGTAQVQALTFKDLTQLDGINKNGAARGIYFYGDIQGVLRTKTKGGDIITLSNGASAGNWLVVQVLETWDVGWCKCACVLQMS